MVQLEVLLVETADFWHVGGESQGHAATIEIVRIFDSGAMGTDDEDMLWFGARDCVVVSVGSVEVNGLE